MRIFTDINADKDLDGFVIAGFGHSDVYKRQVQAVVLTGLRAAGILLRALHVRRFRLHAELV